MLSLISNASFVKPCDIIVSWLEFHELLSRMTWFLWKSRSKTSTGIYTITFSKRHLSSLTEYALTIFIQGGERGWRYYSCPHHELSQGYMGTRCRRIQVSEQNRIKRLTDSIRVISPDRWIEPPKATGSIPGVWGNQLSFLGGQRSCIGFRFALVE